MSSLCSVEKDSIASTRDSFKDCILACKIRNQMHSNFKKRKVPQAVSGNLLKNSLQYMPLYLSPKFLNKTFKVTLDSTISPFQGKFIFTWKIYWTAISVTVTVRNSIIHFLNRYFSELLFLAGDIKINKIYQRKLKPGDRLWALEITHWKLRL